MFVDEAQAIPEIGRALKLLVDGLPHLKVIATGTSAFRLDQEVGQPLTGRRTIRQLFPVGCPELRAWRGPLALDGLLEDLLIYGSYPQVLMTGDPAARGESLLQLVNDYLFQDILSFERLRDPRKLRELLILIAHQIGKEVSLNELATTLQLNRGTVERYLDLLEKYFVVYRIDGFSRNLRKEITKSARYFFVDTGIRNGVLEAFQPLRLRSDTGALFENFFINERIRQNEYARLGRKGYFWRTHDQQEIDWVELDIANNVQAFECKWQQRKYKPPFGWQRTYPDSPVHLVHRSNFGTFV